MSSYANMMSCEWCAADYYVYGRCQRCGQPEMPCNEVAGRSFRMTWDMRSPYFETEAEDEDYPRAPPTRVSTAVRLIFVNTIERAMMSEFIRREMEAMTGYHTRVSWNGPSSTRPEWSGWGPCVVESLANQVPITIRITTD